jgi:hypothetical protein
MSLDAILELDSSGGHRRVRLADYLDAAGEEDASTDAYTWIKALRHARVDGRTFRERFTYRGDSLWWFAELYLHKERAILTLCQTIRATEALIQRERPTAIRFHNANRVVRTAVHAAAVNHGITCSGRFESGASLRLAAMDTRSAALAAAAMASPGRAKVSTARTAVPVAAFVHRAFWKPGGAEDGSAESYIGPVLHALENRLPVDAVEYVGIGPSTNFRVRRWWKPAPKAGRRVVPVEQLVPSSALRGAWDLWGTRHDVRRALESSDDIRDAAVIRGCDCWPTVREALAGIALLQFPWSARAMDEAGAALDALNPDVAVTYAEAGGWGRALALETRRRRIPLAGLQHGFIYRHWLNYRHEPDEMKPLFEGSSDVGFPLPRLTLLFDDYAAEHLTRAGCFPSEAIAVTGSPRLDALAADARTLTDDDIERARREAGAEGTQPLVLIVSKYTEIRPYLGPLLDAITSLAHVHGVIKTHPAETPSLYESAGAAAHNVRVLPAASPLGPLLRAAAAVVTVNSTVAIDSLVLGTPALSIGLPNNLSPFVQAGAMAGAASDQEIETVLRRVLYDQGFRQQLGAAAAATAARYRISPDGGAAERSASAILGLSRSPAADH